MVEDIHYYTWRSRRYWSEENLITIFTEGDRDAAFYRRMTGPSLGRYLRYECCKGPKGRTGAHNAWSLMREKRRLDGGGALGQHVNRFYCLLDGEEAAHAAVPYLQKAASFVVNDVGWFEPLAQAELYSTFTEPDGILFLGCHEIENIYLLHAGLLDVIFRHWGRTRTLFGSAYAVRDSWRILQRALIISELTEFAKTYNLEHKAFHTALNAIRRPDTSLKAKIETIIETLRFPDQSKKPLDRIVPPKLLSDECAALMDRVMDLEAGNADISDFDPRLLTVCDGKTFLKMALPGNNDWHEFFDSTLVANGFTTCFQLGLSQALQKSPPRPIHFGDPFSPEDQWTVGKGATAWTARRRSHRNLPPILLPEEPLPRTGA